MSEFDKRQEGFEKKFALDEEQKFKAEARRNRLRSWPEPSETGGTNGSPNTSSGTLPR